jgi:cobyrinic acid a,c-diamide synthase
MNHADSENSVTCPALFISAPSSGEGKTTITCALARYFKNQGKLVRVFKTGPDYLDPQILAQASGNEVEQLDMWMAGDAWCRDKLFEAACNSDLILIEGAMGLFDGEPSSADLAAKFGIPVLVVMNVKGMAQTAGAVIRGLAQYRDDFNLVAMIANNCATNRHRELIEMALPNDVTLAATFARDESVALPERHLGLVQASEVTDELEVRFENGAQALINGGMPKDGRYLENAGRNFQGMHKDGHALLLEGFESAGSNSRSRCQENWLKPIQFTRPNEKELQPFQTGKWLQGKTIAIAKDKAFSFIYQSNVSLLEQMGAKIQYFSPLMDQQLPEVDGLWLPGGYPELYAPSLAKNETMLASIKAFHNINKPILAECGGLLYSLKTLTDLQDETYPMVGILAGHGAMRGKRGCQGMQTACLPEGEIRGHAHHRSRSYDTPTPVGFGRRQRHVAPGEEIYRSKQLTASYLHLFFASNPGLVAQIFNPSLDRASVAHQTSEADASC